VSRQPNWKLLANLGDVNPIDHGGYFVYQDTTGIYTEEAEKLFVYEDSWQIYRFPLDRLKMVQGYLVPLRYSPDWPEPLPRYDEWFHKDLDKVASYIGQSAQELQEAFCSEDARVRAFAYEAIGGYHGYENLDGYPLTFTNRKEIEARYKKEVSE